MRFYFGLFNKFLIITLALGCGQSEDIKAWNSINEKYDKYTDDERLTAYQNFTNNFKDSKHSEIAKDSIYSIKERIKAVKISNAINEVLEQVNYFETRMDENLKKFVGDNIKGKDELDLNGVVEVFTLIQKTINIHFIQLDQISLDDCPVSFKTSFIEYKSLFSPLQESITEFISFVNEYNENPFGKIIESILMGEQYKKDQISEYQSKLSPVLNNINELDLAKKRMDEIASTYLLK